MDTATAHFTKTVLSCAGPGGPGSLTCQAAEAFHMTGLLTVRHGETDWNREGRIQGWAPVGLNERGRDQARRLAGDLGDLLGEPPTVDRLVVSDLRRTRETAEVLRGELGLPEPTPERAFRERNVGVYQGLPADHVVERHPDLEDLGSVTGLSVTPEGGESLADLAERVREGVGALRGSAGADDTVLLVTHGGPIRVLLADALASELDAAIREHAPSNCGLFAFELTEEGLSFVGESCAV